MKIEKHLNLKFLIFICLIGLVSCGKDDTTIASVSSSFTPSPLLLKERRINNLLHSSFEYNNEGLIEKITFYQPTGDPIYIDSYVYDTDTTISIRVEAVSNANVYTRKYYLVSENQGRRDTYEAGEYVGYRYYNFTDDASCGYYSALSYNTFGQLDGAIDYDFTDDNCSSVITISSSITTSFIESEYFRGNKYDSYNSIRIPFFRIDRFNNIETYVKRNEQEDLIESSSYTTDIEFNDMDHPEREVRNYRDGNVRVYTYEYY